MWAAAISLVVALPLSGCGAPGLHIEAASDEGSNEQPQRIVSLDYCADQYVLKLADREQVLAVSPSAMKDFSYMRAAAVGVRAVRPIAEDVLILKPDLVVRSFGGGPNAAAFFERAGVPVLQVGWASNVDGEDAGSIPYLIQRIANGLGHPQRGAALVDEFRTRLTAVRARQSGDVALYMTPAGDTTGPGSLVHEMLLAAGLENFQQRPGWGSLPLERLAYEQPDLVVAAFYEALNNNPDAWSASQHPVAKAQLAEPGTVPLQGAWTACGGWFILDAIEALAEGAEP
ncbi:MAG: ABC transporter substrate-binding protein [Pseudomonadota bacterium]